MKTKKVYKMHPKWYYGQLCIKKLNAITKRAKVTNYYDHQASNGSTEMALIGKNVFGLFYRQHKHTTLSKH